MPLINKSDCEGLNLKIPLKFEKKGEDVNPVRRHEATGSILPVKCLYF
ncbi:hypothetical protein SBDP1_1040035 [Syntrophobacter sp. SbD1]|nr:hypothetical protein SBDP1_1040035 [Syntrophobacter sp. SbD1]